MEREIFNRKSQYAILWFSGILIKGEIWEAWWRLLITLPITSSKQLLVMQKTKPAYEDLTVRFMCQENAHV